jgi:class 3 adenylate cyclase
VLIGSFARRIWAPDHPWGPTADERRQRIDAVQRGWPQPDDLARRAPSLAKRPGASEWWCRFLRMGASPGAAAALLRMNAEVDVRHLLSAIRVPALILHSAGDRIADVRAGRYMAERVRQAKYVELPGADHLPWGDDADAILDEVEEFLTGVRHGPELDRVLATVMFTDIVDSTRRASEIGDRRWRELLEQHHMTVREQLKRFRGREIDTAGDGFLAAFDGPARAVRAACAVTSGVRKLGLDVRTGLHTGECEVIGKKLTGIAVHIGARVAALAGPGEVIVSGTVKDLLAGSGLKFRERGTHELKGVPGPWQLYSVNIDG